VPGIVAIGFQGGSGATEGEVRGFPLALSKEHLEPLIDAVGAAIDQAGHAIAVYPTWAPPSSLQRLATVRAATDIRRLAVYPTSLPPLAGAVLAELAAAVSTYVPSPGVLLSGLRLLEKELIVAAWLGSVARLREPQPTLAQHLASWWPRTAFAVALLPQPIIRRLTKKDRRLAVPEPREPIRLAVSVHEGDPGWVREVLVPSLGLPPVDQVAPTPEGPSWWGTRRLVEVVGHPTDISAMAGRISLGVEGSLCGWCDETIASNPCPFCGLDARRGAA
jgi:hypothetical protein